MLQSSSLGEVVTGLIALGALALRVGGRLALARYQRRAMTMLALALAATGRPVRVRRQVRGEEWSIEVAAPGQPDQDAAEPGGR